MTQELTRLTAKLELESQEILASEPGNPSNGEESEGLSDARNADEEQSDTESEVPSVIGLRISFFIFITLIQKNMSVAVLPKKFSKKNKNSPRQHKLC